MRRIFALALVLYLAVGCGIAETAEVEAAGSVNADGKNAEPWVYIYSCLKAENTYYLMLSLSTKQKTANIENGSELLAMYAALPTEGAIYPTSGARMSLQKVTDEVLIETLLQMAPQGYNPMFNEITSVRSLG